MTQVRVRLTQEEAVEAYALAARLRREHAAMCCWHVVLDDGNVDDATVASCAEDVDETHATCVALGPLLQRMTRTQRKKAGAA